jgi:NodT family efflux transporter outer membrane factor (OMF) lipoprotein
MRATLALLGSCVLFGCSLAPPYQPPPIEIPPVYKETGPWLHASPDRATRGCGPWWVLYDDPILNELEAQVMVGNQDIKAALARYDQAHAILMQERAALYPSLLGVFNANRQQTSKNSANPQPVHVYTDLLLSMNLTYEVDLWGRVRNSVAAATSLAQASAADLSAINLSLQAQLASDYFTLRGYDAQIKILENIVSDYERALYLTRQRYRGGAVAVTDVDQALTQWNAAKTLVADMRLKRAQVEHAIAVLIGRPPAVFSLKPAAFRPKPVTMAPDLPSTLLERRPDIAEAELKVQAANANIGVARAAFFPAINLSAAIGLESHLLSNLFKASSLVWALGPTTSSALLNNGSMPLVTQTIFDGGRLIALSQQAWAQFCETAANYRQTVLTAFQEVEDNLVAIRQLDQEVLTESLAARAANRAFIQSTYRYKEGLTTYLDVVVSQNLFLQTQLSTIDIRIRRQLASVQLIKALGGGY